MDYFCKKTFQKNLFFLQFLKKFFWEFKKNYDNFSKTVTVVMVVNWSACCLISTLLISVQIMLKSIILIL